jgi:hypothetical protein
MNMHRLARQLLFSSADESPQALAWQLKNDKRKDNTRLPTVRQTPSRQSGKAGENFFLEDLASQKAQ